MPHPNVAPFDVRVGFHRRRKRGILQGWRDTLVRAPSSHEFLIEKLAVRTHANELKNLRVRLAINQQQIGLKVTLAMIAPFASQYVVVILFGQPPVLRQQRNCNRYQGFHFASVLPALLALEIAAKSTGAFNPPH